MPTKKAAVKTADKEAPAQAADIAKQVIMVLDKIIDEYLEDFRKTDGNYLQVAVNYGYGKYYIDKVEGGFAYSLQSLIHYIMVKDGLYERFLTAEQLASLQAILTTNPSGIYYPGRETQGDINTANMLDKIYYISIKFVAEILQTERIEFDEALNKYLD